jgi:hypothetical protein
MIEFEARRGAAEAGAISWPSRYRAAGEIGMTAKRSATTLLAATAAVLLTVPALAQQVLVCYTLHNDLANFDRRANAPNYMYGQEAIAQALREYQWLCPSGRARAPDTDCVGLQGDPGAPTAGFYQMIREWVVSPLGGSDPVRLRIIDEMYRNGCPLPPEALYLISLRSRTSARPHRDARPVVRALGSAEPQKGVRSASKQGTDKLPSPATSLDGPP